MKNENSFLKKIKNKKPIKYSPIETSLGDRDK